MKLGTPLRALIDGYMQKKVWARFLITSLAIGVICSLVVPLVLSFWFDSLRLFTVCFYVAFALLLVGIYSPQEIIMHMRESLLHWLLHFVATEEERIAPAKGAYLSGDVITKWLDGSEDDLQTVTEKERRMQLCSEIVFVDNQREWIAPAKSFLDGASIPKPFWITVGTPYGDSYRRASVVHDYYCEDLVREEAEVFPASKQVHRMFYNAMHTDGVDPKKAEIIYLAVKIFGPRWQEKTKAVQ